MVSRKTPAQPPSNKKDDKGILFAIGGIGAAIAGLFLFGRKGAAGPPLEAVGEPNIF